MSTPLADQPAFPVSDSVYPNGQVQFGFTGLTTCQHFAAMAMHGLLMSNSVSVPKGFGRSTESAVRAKLAVLEADALIAELEEKK